MIDFKRPIQTKNGLLATLLATDISGDFPVWAAILHGDGRKTVEAYTLEGNYANFDRPNVLDLVNVPRKVKVERWVALLSNGEVHSFSTPLFEVPFKERNSVVGVKHIEFEIVEGEGL